MFLPDNITTDKKTVDYIRENLYNKMQLHEPTDKNILLYEY